VICRVLASFLIRRWSSFVRYVDFGLSLILGHSLSGESRSKMAQNQRVAGNGTTQVGESVSSDHQPFLSRSTKQPKTLSIINHQSTHNEGRTCEATPAHLCLEIIYIFNLSYLYPTP